MQEVLIDGHGWTKPHTAPFGGKTAVSSDQLACDYKHCASVIRTKVLQLYLTGARASTSYV